MNALAKGLPKTNAMRILDREKISYRVHTYAHDGEAVDGMHVAALLGVDAARIFKTLVTQGKSGQYYVFVIPAPAELDLKAAAACVGEKHVEMLHVKDLLPVTGYVRGGCSPVGMKKAFPTVIDRTAQDFKTIIVSAGKIGVQVELAPDDLRQAAKAEFGDITQ